MKNLIFFGILLLFITIALGCTQYNPFDKDVSPLNSTLTFSVDRCASGMDPHSAPTAGILNQTWKDKSTFVVEFFIIDFCGGSTFTGDYLIEGNKLVIIYNVETADDVTLCNCAHKLIYEFSNIEYKDYDVSISRPY